MASFVLEDMTSSINCVIFPKEFQQYSFFTVDMLVEISGNVKINDYSGENQLNVYEIRKI